MQSLVMLLVGAFIGWLVSYTLYRKSSADLASKHDAEMKAADRRHDAELQRADERHSESMKQGEGLMKQLTAANRTLEDLQRERDEAREQIVSLTASAAGASSASGNLTVESRPPSDEQREAWITDVDHATDSWSTEWVGLSDATDSMKKFNLRWWNEYDRDAYDVSVSFGAYERIKLAGKRYDELLASNGDALSIFFAPDMALPSPFPVIVTFKIAGDRYERQYTWEGFYEG